jgi:hypothetical protein
LSLSFCSLLPPTDNQRTLASRFLAAFSILA